MRRHREPTMREVTAGCFQWWSLYLLAFLFTFPFWARPLLGAARYVLEGLNNFGSGM